MLQHEMHTSAFSDAHQVHMHIAYAYMHLQVLDPQSGNGPGKSFTVLVRDRGICLAMYRQHFAQRDSLCSRLHVNGGTFFQGFLGQQPLYGLAAVVLHSHGHLTHLLDASQHLLTEALLQLQGGPCFCCGD